METKEVHNSLYGSGDLADAFFKQGILIFRRKRNNICAWTHDVLRSDYLSRRVFEDAFSSILCDNWKGHFFSSDTDIIAIDSDGTVLLRNVDARIKKDDNGFIHIYEPKTNFYNIVKSYEIKNSPNQMFYFVSSDLKKLNSQIKNAVEKKIIAKPKDYSSRLGLKNLPLFPVSDQPQPN